MNFRIRKTNAAAAFMCGCLFLAGAAGTGTMVYAGEKTPEMSLEEYPRIDGSLACVPLCEALAVQVTGCTQMASVRGWTGFCGGVRLCSG